MVKIKRANGELVPFDKERLVHSIINANVNRTIAEGIADKTPVTDGMLSSELRSIVSEQLNEYDPVSAEIYSTKGKLSARSSDKPAEGKAHLSLSAMDRLKVKVGDIIDIFYSDSSHGVTVEEAGHSREEIHLHEEDIRKLGVADGIQIQVRRRL